MCEIDQKNENPRLVVDLGGTRVRTAFVHSSKAIDRHTQKSDKTAKAITIREDLRDLIVENIISGGLQQRTHVLSLAGPIFADNQNREGGIEDNPVRIRPGCMYRPAVRTQIPPRPKSLMSVVKEPRHISMAPDSSFLTFRAAGNLRPGIIFTLFSKALEIDSKAQYQ